MEEYVICAHHRDTLDEGGYGPVSHRGTHALDSWMFGYGRYRRIDGGKAPPDLRIEREKLKAPPVVVQAAIDLVFVLAETEAAQHGEIDHNFLGGTSCVFRCRIDALDQEEPAIYLGGQPALNDFEGATWVDYEKSAFEICKSVSLGGKKPPRITLVDVRGRDFGELEDQKPGRSSTLATILPTQLYLKAERMPDFFLFDGKTYFREATLRRWESEGFLGLERTQAKCVCGLSSN